MKYRPHRGSLDASMKEAVEVDGFAGLLAHLEKTHSAYAPPFDASKIRIKPYSGADKRIGWASTCIVVDDRGPLGFTDCLSDENESR